jgi:hypothetical protein
MQTQAITNPVVRSAIEAWQAGSLDAWLAHFAPGVQLLDDGQPRDFMSFSREIGHERFTSIDLVRRAGTEVIGAFHSDTWGDFRTYFRFTLDESGKVTRLEIGQAND